MGIAKNIDSAFTLLWPSLKSVVKIAVCGMNFIPSLGSVENDRLVILGNGPSLREQLDDPDFFSKLCESITLCVNFAANAPEFFRLRPRYYVLADPHFFAEVLASDFRNDNIRQLIDNLRKVDWSMELFVALNRKQASALAKAIGNENIAVTPFPAVGIEGWRWLEKFAMTTKRGMPKPRNVLIPSIMLGIWLGYSEIYLLGADHSWLSTVSVDNFNRVVSIQPHFYKDSSQELKRQNAVYSGVSLPELLNSFLIAFKGYHQLQRFAAGKNISIYNATPGSYIDAFPRRSFIK